MEPTPDILVTFAVPEEARPFRELPHGRWRVQTVVTGIGARNAERSLRERLGDRLPRLVLTCGFAGGLNPALQVGDLVGEAVDDSLLNTALIGAGVRRVRFHCADRIAVTADDKRALYAQTGADAVEMESAVIRRVCAERGVPAATVRVISDGAADDLPLDFNALAGPEWRLRYGRLLAALARQPGKVPDLVRFQRRITAAAGRLATALREVIGRWNAGNSGLTTPAASDVPSTK